jgi:hypothetical protein
MASLYEELKALVTALDPEQVLKEPYPMEPVDYSREAVTRRLKLASELGDVCRYLKKVGRQLQVHNLPKPPAKKPS